MSRRTAFNTIRTRFDGGVARWVLPIAVSFVVSFIICFLEGKQVRFGTTLAMLTNVAMATMGVIMGFMYIRKGDNASVYVWRKGTPLGGDQGKLEIAVGRLSFVGQRTSFSFRPLNITFTDPPRKMLGMDLTQPSPTKIFLPVEEISVEFLPLKESTSALAERLRHWAESPPDNGEDLWPPITPSPGEQNIFPPIFCLVIGLMAAYVPTGMKLWDASTPACLFATASLWAIFALVLFTPWPSKSRKAVEP